MASKLPALPDTRTDPELVQRFLNGDRTARDRVLAHWAPTVLAWCMRMGGRRVDAHDAAQDVMIVILTKGHTCRDAEKFPAWVYGVTRKVLGRHRTVAWVRKWTGGLVPDRADGGHSPRVRAQVSQTGRRVQDVLETLTAAQRDLLILHDLEGRSATEVGKLIGVPSGTVKSRVRRARELFRMEAARRSLSMPMVDALREGMTQ